MSGTPNPRPAPLPWSTRIFSNLVQAPLFGIATAFFGSLSLVASLIEKNGRMQHRVASIWAKFVMFISGSPVRIIGGEMLSRFPVAIYASNHASYMDTPVIFSVMTMQFRILARHDLWKIPFIGWYLQRSGQIPINAENARASVSSLNIGVKALKAGMPLFIFPEGGRSRTGHLQPFLNGASYLAVRAGVPIIPMALIGTYELLPIHTGQFYPRPLVVAVGEPILPEGYTSKDLERLTSRLRSAISDLYYEHSGLSIPADGAGAEGERGLVEENG